MKNSPTTANIVCKHTEYVTMYPWMNNSYFIVLDDKEKKMREGIRKLNMLYNGEYDVPCQCPRCSTAAR